MRVVTVIRCLRRHSDALAAVGLLIAVVALSPPRIGEPQLAAGMTVTVALTVGALQAMRRSTRPHWASRLGTWARVTAALAASASILMIAAATAAVMR